MLRAFIVGSLMLSSIIACAREDEAPAPQASAAPSDTTVVAASTPTDPNETNLDAAAQTQQESTGSDAAADEGDPDLARLAALPAAEKLPAGKWQPGKNYEVLVPAQPTDVAAGKVQVDEMFWYGCGHCYTLDPYLESWSKNKPEYIEFARVPVMWGPAHKSHARLFYTLQALNRMDLHTKVFDEIHRGNNMLVANDEARSKALQLAFAKANGVSEADFLREYDSFSVNSNLQRAEQLTRRYRVEGVPLVVVAGKYTTDVGKAGGQSQLVQLINDLAASEKRR